MENKKHYLDAFGKFCNIELMESGNGSARSQLTVRPEHLNQMGTIHGGLLFTLADCTFGAAAISRGCSVFLINASIYYVKAVSSGTIYAIAKELSHTRKLGVYSIDILTAEQELIARFEGTAYKKAD